MNRATADRTQVENHVEDGRTARGRRTREAVVEAVIALLNEGDVRPTAARVADRAGVSLRSVFQHFTDLEDLFTTVADRQFTVVQGLPPAPDPSVPLPERIAAFAERRAELLERITPVRRAAVLQEPFSRVVHDRLERIRAAGRAEIERTFEPELAGLPEPIRAETVAALRVATAWTAWENLRREQDLPKATAQQIYRRLIASILDGALAQIRRVGDEVSRAATEA